MSQNVMPQVEVGSLTPEEIFTRDYTPSRFDAIGAALTQENLIGVGINLATDFTVGTWYDKDEDFDIAQHEDLFTGVDSEYWDNLQGAKSREHLRMLAHRYRKLTADTNYLDQLGGEGVFYRAASLIGDVPMISALQKVRGAGKLADVMMSARSTYTGRALLAGTIEGSFEGFKQIASPAERTEMDMLMAVAGGGLLGGLYNPMKYDPATQQVMRETVADAISTRGTGRAQEAGGAIRKTIEDKQINVSSVFRDSPSQTMRELGKKLLNDPLQQQLDEFTGIEVRDNVKMAMDNAFSLNFDKLYLEYMEKMYGKKFATINRLNASKQDEFYNLMGDRFYNRANALMDEVPEEFLTRVDDAFSKMSNDAYDIMYRNKHSKFVSGEIDKVDDYMPLSWVRDKIKASTAQGLFKRGDFEKAVRNGLENRMADLGIEATADKLNAAAKKFASRMYEEDIPIGGQNYIMKDNSMRRAVDELQDIMEMTDEEADLLKDLLRSKTEGAAKGTASSTKFRTPLDLEGSYTTADGYTINLKDFVDTNIQSAWHRYGHSMGGDTALRNLGVNSRGELQELRNKIVKELSNESGGIPSGNTKYLENFDNAVGHLLGMSAKSDPMGDAWKVTRMMNNLTRSAKLGMTWFAMAAEVARVSHRIGIQNMVKTIPALRDIARAYKGKGFSPVYRELQLHEALGGELNQMVSIAKYEDVLRQVEVDGSARFLDRAERFSDIANEATMLVGGVKTGTSVLEYWHAIGARVKMMDMARKGLDEKAYNFYSKYGFSRDTADQIADNIRRFGSKDENAPLLNLDKWDGDLGHKWSLGVRRQSYEIVQRSNFGDHVGMTMDGKLVGDTVLGSLAMSLKNYMIVAYNKQLSKGLTDMSRGGKDAMDVLGNWSTQAAFASVSYIAKQYAVYGNDPEKLEEMLSPERIAANTFSMTTFASFIPNVVDFGAQAFTDEPVFNTFAKGQQSGFMPAPVQYATDAISGVSALTNLASPWGQASEHELRKALGTLPLSNALGVKMLTNEMAEAFAEDTKNLSGW